MLGLCQYPAANKGTVVVWSLIASHVLPGSTWHRLQYLAGLRQLGFDVWYVEDSDRSLRDPATHCHTRDFGPNVEYLAYHMQLIGFEDRWVFRPPGQHPDCLGARDMAGLADLYRDADLVINHSGAQELRPEHESIRRLLYLETDPVRSQVGVAKGDGWETVLAPYHDLLTYAENLGAPDCQLPVKRFHWTLTRPAICVDWWAPKNAGNSTANALTTIANWQHSGRDVTWKGKRWSWSKHHEFLRFVDLPAKSPLPLELALGANINRTDLNLLAQKGWRIVSAQKLNETYTYRDYIRNSLGEFTAAKEQYVAPRSGWFSDRSATYLAAGRPVITQDTGFSNILPTGEGLFAFSTAEEALTAMDAIAGDYRRHADAALEIAREYFSTKVVIGKTLKTIGLL